MLPVEDLLLASTTCFYMLSLYSTITCTLCVMQICIHMCSYCSLTLHKKWITYKTIWPLSTNWNTVKRARAYVYTRTHSRTYALTCSRITHTKIDRHTCTSVARARARTHTHTHTHSHTHKQTKKVLRATNSRTFAHTHTCIHMNNTHAHTHNIYPQHKYMRTVYIPTSSTACMCACIPWFMGAYAPKNTHTYTICTPFHCPHVSYNSQRERSSSLLHLKTKCAIFDSDSHLVPAMVSDSDSASGSSSKTFSVSLSPPQTQIYMHI